MIWHCKFKQTLFASNLLLVMGFIIVIETLTQTPSEISFLLYRPQGSSRLRGKREFQSSSCPFSAFKLEETTAQGMDGSGENRLPVELTLGAASQSGLAGADMCGLS